MTGWDCQASSMIGANWVRVPAMLRITKDISQIKDYLGVILMTE